jgi:hypothetical protein
MKKLQSTVKVLKDKVILSEGNVEKLKGQKAQLLEEVENLVAARDEAFQVLGTSCRCNQSG